MIIYNTCVHLVCGKYCQKLNTKCLEVRLLGGVGNCSIREEKKWPRPAMPQVKPPKKSTGIGVGRTGKGD